MRLWSELLRDESAATVGVLSDSLHFHSIQIAKLKHDLSTASMIHSLVCRKNICFKVLTSGIDSTNKHILQVVFHKAFSTETIDISAKKSHVTSCGAAGTCEI